MKKFFFFLSYVVLISALIAAITHITHLQEKNESLEKRNKSLKKDSNEWKDTYLNLQTEMNKRESEDLEKSYKLEELVLTKEELFKEIKNTLEPAFEHVINSERISRKTIDELQENIVGQISVIVANEQERFSELRKKLNEKIITVNRENSELEANLRTMSTELEKMIERRLKMQGEMRNELRSSEDEIITFNTKVAKLETKLNQKYAEIQQLRSESKKKEKELDRMKSRARNLSDRLSEYKNLQQRTFDYAGELGDNFLRSIKKDHLVRHAGSTIKDIVTLNWFKNLDYKRESEKIKEELFSLEEESSKLKAYIETERR